jgi:hypothetical protein
MGRGKPVFSQSTFKIRQMQCRVETYSGFRLHERPRRFTWGETWLDVQQVMAQWVAPGHICFQVRVEDRIFLLKYDRWQDVWEVSLIRPGAKSGLD